MLDVYEDRKEISRILELYQTEGMNTLFYGPGGRMKHLSQNSGIAKIPLISLRCFTTLLGLV